MGWDKDLPSGSVKFNLGDNAIRANNAELQTSLEEEHTPFDGGPGNPGDADGRHKWCTLQAGAKPPVNGTDGAIYAKDVAGVTELFYRDENDVEIQLTSNGTITGLAAKLNVSGGLMTGNLDLSNAIYLRGQDTGATERNLLGVDGADIVQVGPANVLEMILNTLTELKVKIGAAAAVKIWHESNDGTGSGLDADTVDGTEGADLMKWSTGNYTLKTIKTGLSYGAHYSTGHGFGAMPRLVQFFLEVIDGSHFPGNLGYTVGDRFPLMFPIDCGVGSRGAFPYFNSSTLGVVIGGSAMYMMHKTLFTSIALTSNDMADLAVKAHAWK